MTFLRSLPFVLYALWTWRALRHPTAAFRYWGNLRSFNQNKEHPFPFGTWYPQLFDRYESSGTASGHYFHQDLLVAQRIFESAPQKHVDIGSRVDGFVAHVASFREIEVFDIRPSSGRVHNVTFREFDVLAENFPETDYCDSLSCLHALEHFGLGRYGDPVDSLGHVRGLRGMTKILKPGGMFYLSVPLGEKQRVEYDAHRVFSLPYLLKLVDTDFDLLKISYVDDKGDLHRHVEASADARERSFGCDYGCVILELRKRT